MIVLDFVLACFQNIQRCNTREKDGCCNLIINKDLIRLRVCGVWETRIGMRSRSLRLDTRDNLPWLARLGGQGLGAWVDCLAGSLVRLAGLNFP